MAYKDLSVQPSSVFLVVPVRLRNSLRELHA